MGEHDRYRTAGRMMEEEPGTTVASVVRKYHGEDGEPVAEWAFHVARREPSALFAGTVAVVAEFSRIGEDGERVGGSGSTLHLPAELFEDVAGMMLRAAERVRGEEVGA